jgi:hypothetical protein
MAGRKPGLLLQSSGVFKEEFLVYKEERGGIFS